MKLPVAVSGSGVRPNRAVGMFYFIWHNRPGGDLPPLGSPHYWGEPLYGYYHSMDLRF